ncbi:MAG: hypothetical protein EA379_09605 [Phycisphaerales bacterium]|nr:MAG: hypothetical protein EA379_09605 [Phycisphaerales bacterium]
MRTLPRSVHRSLTTLLAGALAVLLGFAMSACNAKERPRPRAEGRPLVVRDLPAILRNTIGSETTIQGAEQVLVSGYGIVVGLNGTGSGDAPVDVRAWMEREMSLRGIGSASMGMGGVSPREMIDDPNTSIVLVQSTVSPGLPRGSRFDVLVSALPGSATTSLEGGTLYTTDLRPGMPTAGGPSARIFARASGPIFINPFADPAKQDVDAIVRTSGRILNGGEMTNPLELIITLDNPSHSRARAITAAINTAFPQKFPDRQPTAKGRNDEAIALVIPRRYRDNVGEFMELLAHTRIDQSFPQEWSVRYTRELRDEPRLAESLSWCLQAIGPVAIPQLRPLYDFPELVPRLAALRAGARLGDALATPHLRELATSGPESLRLEAIELLAGMGSDPQVNIALRKLTEEKDIAVRIAAYEALVARRDPTLRRRVIADGKFLLDVLPSKEPMIYVSQQGEPRIAIFGDALEIDRPTLVFAWEDRLILASDSPGDDLRVMYQDYRTRKVTQATADPRLVRFIEFLAHETTPEQPAPGLSMSYSEVVGALYELTERRNAIPARFVAEQDRLQAELLAAIRTSLGSERPELAGETEPPDLLAEQPLIGALRDGDASRPAGETARPSFVVPLQPATPPSRSDPIP